MGKNLFKGLSRRIRNYITNENEREYVRLFMKWGGYSRYATRENVRFLDYAFTIPDLQTFLGQFQEIFVGDCYKFVPQTPEPTIVDCGANIGLSCLYYNRMYPKSRVIAFEADPKIFPVLKRNLRDNHVNNVELLDKAVWINDGDVDFSIEGADGGSIYGSKNVIKVKCVRLKDVLAKYSLIDFLKIDIEGAEYEVVEDCKDSLGNVENIFIEYHSWSGKDQKLGEILSILESNKFRYFIEVPTRRTSPLTNRGEDRGIDMHMNIYGWKNPG